MSSHFALKQITALDWEVAPLCDHVRSRETVWRHVTIFLMSSFWSVNRISHYTTEEASKTRSDGVLLITPVALPPKLTARGIAPEIASVMNIFVYLAFSSLLWERNEICQYCELNEICQYCELNEIGQYCELNESGQCCELNEIGQYCELNEICQYCGIKNERGSGK